MKKGQPMFAGMFIMLFCCFTLGVAKADSVKCGKKKTVNGDVGPVCYSFSVLNDSTKALAKAKYAARLVRLSEVTCDASRCDEETDTCEPKFDSYSGGGAIPDPTQNDADGQWCFDAGSETYVIRCTQCTEASKEVEGEVKPVGKRPGNDLGSTDDPEMPDAFNGNGMVHKLYPNPAGEMINLELDVTEAGMDLEYRIVDAMGRIVQQSRTGQLVQGHQTVQTDVSGLSPGLYFLTMSHQQQSVGTARFMVSE